MLKRLLIGGFCWSHRNYTVWTVDFRPSRRYIPGMQLNDPKENSARPERGVRVSHVRQKVFAAMRHVIAQQGAPHLTLEAVAAEAGISKGGLLYHFPSKDALWQGFLEDFHENFIRQCWKEFQEDSKPDRPGRIHRAWIRSFMKMDPARDVDADLSDVAAIITNVQFVKPMKAFWKAWETILAKDGIDEETSLIIKMSLSGIKMERIMDYVEVTDAQRERLFERLLEIATLEAERMDYGSEGEQWERCTLDAWKGQ